MPGSGLSDAQTLAKSSGWIVICLHLAYALVTIAGFAFLPSAAAPIADPWFAAMEWLILAVAPATLLFLSCLIALVRPDGRSWAIAGLANATVALALSGALHVMLLTLGRDHALVTEDGLLAFRWPSLAYGLDILAWDWFFAIAMLCSGAALHGSAHARFAGRSFVLSGILAMIGLIGPILGSMEIRNIGIIGYAIGFPISVWLFLRTLRPLRGMADDICQKS